MKRKSLAVILGATLVAFVLMGCGAVDLMLARVTPPAAATPAPDTRLVQTAPGVTVNPGVLSGLENALSAIYEEVNPSVVSIQVVQKVSAPEVPFFGLPPMESPGDQYQRGSGSGFVWDKEGHIVTNNHVVAGADRIRVRFADGTIVEAEVVGSDPDSDLAVLKVDVDAALLRPVRLATDDVRVGQLAIAIGSPFGLENTMTVGFISAIGRLLPVDRGAPDEPHYSIPDVIQTDAPINPGNSGGVLVNDEGKVIGVTSAIISPARASAGIGFAIPSRIVAKVVPVLIEEGHYTHPWLGISGITLTPEMAKAMGLDPDQRGGLVIEVVPGGPADKAGLRGSGRQITVDGQNYRVGGDVIVGIDDEPVREFDDIIAYLARTEVGQKVRLRILRDGRERTVEVTLGARPTSRETDAADEGEARGGTAWLGILGIDLTPQIAEAMDLPREQEGVLVEEVVAQSPADEAGLRGSYKPITVNGERIRVGGDIIVGWDDEAVSSVRQLREFVAAHQPGDEVTLRVLREGREIRLSVTLGERP